MAFLSIVIGYLLGAVSFSYLAGQIMKKLDIRDHGSGNAGATNTLRVLGTGPAVAVLLLDCAKGIAAVWIGYSMSGGDPLFAALAGAASVIGHNWPVYFGFRGGKGVATTIGVLATIVFWPALAAGIAAIASIFITRYVSLGSLLFMTGTTILLPFFNYPAVYFYTVLGLTILSFWRHRTNIKRLISGTESRIGEKAS
ncbi:glycerol-3-phosphate 1-O-acyltransferase PlsY [Alkalicoccus urumqiensis]|uniref:Glycerol-3-phosphate acyltransferase n=1 Tax=Alkalicoccus urumqiensis TaxID=1548213 RepID=A0A2P6MKH9_ALKUR|nr:glycerol-3-phosphate 1-O-acyltransferase PlsY [Alkalicoccus urumqiensis]PRO66799.1 acyl-phosphate glycerol 3-phosphate acyltransferase [Alkalicoccus urumqiensis]